MSLLLRQVLSVLASTQQVLVQLTLALYQGWALLAEGLRGQGCDLLLAAVCRTHNGLLRTINRLVPQPGENLGRFFNRFEKIC